MSTHGFLFQWATKRVGLIQRGHHYHLIECNLVSTWFSWNIAHLTLSNNHSLILVSPNSGERLRTWSPLVFVCRSSLQSKQFHFYPVTVKHMFKALYSATWVSRRFIMESVLLLFFRVFCIMFFLPLDCQFLIAPSIFYNI